MPRFSRRSLRRREGVHPDLCRLFDRVVLRFDCLTLKHGGVRTPELQQSLVSDGASTTLNSKHLIQSSGYGHAIDIAPYWRESPHIRWPSDDLEIEEAIERWRVWSAFGGYVIGVAESLDINVRWGQDWDGDWDFAEHGFIDSPHWELI